MYLNDLNSATHSVEKLNRVLADTFGHHIDLSEMSTNALTRMLTTTRSKMQQIVESDLAYWNNPQYNKLNLIQHQLRTYIKEVAPTRSDGKKMKNKKTFESTDLASAEVLLAAQELVDKLQGMIEDLAEMQVQELMPIVDAMKEQVGFDIAEQYNSQAEAALSSLLDQAKSAKEALENATLQAQGKPVNGPAATNMGMDMSTEPEMDMDDEFDGDSAAAGDENTLGRELKSESLDQMERRAVAEAKILAAKAKVLEAARNSKIPAAKLKKILRDL
jgi:uncharacterized LabA/DUF88 family protein